ASSSLATTPASTSTSPYSASFDPSLSASFASSSSSTSATGSPLKSSSSSSRLLAPPSPLSISAPSEPKPKLAEDHHTSHNHDSAVLVDDIRIRFNSAHASNELPPPAFVRKDSGAVSAIGSKSDPGNFESGSCS